MNKASFVSSELQLLYLLQLASPALPVGAYSYSEGLETLVQSGQLQDVETLLHWLTHELRYGAIQFEIVALVRSHLCVQTQDLESLKAWNNWLSALRDTEELRHQSWQMGQSLVRLLRNMQPEAMPFLQACGEPHNFAVVYAIATALWNIDCRAAVLGYLHSWATNLVNAGVKLIPLGQTAGQQLLIDLYPDLEQTAERILQAEPSDFNTCSWGLAIASMNHETLYSRLFRS